MVTIEPLAATRVPLTERTGFLSHKMGCLLQKEIESGLARFGINSRSYLVLAGVDQDPPPSQQDLSRLLNIDPTTIVGVIDELEGAGLVTRSRNTVDRRRYNLLLTDVGRATLDEAHEAMDGASLAFFAPLTPDELKQFHLLLKRLLAGR